MKYMQLKNLLGLVLALGLSTQVFAQELLKIGDALPTLNLKDQHDNPYDVPVDTQRILFAADNEGNMLATGLIESHEPDWLTLNKEVYLADIHKMPSLVARFIAIPKLRKKPYPILLGRDETDLQAFPRKKDCVTVLLAKSGKVSEVVFACSRQELLAAGTL